MIIGCSPTSNYAIFFFKKKFRTASEILFRDRHSENLENVVDGRFFQDQKILTLQHTSVPFHKLKQNVKILTFYQVLTPAPRSPTLKLKTGHIKRVIISNCTKFPTGDVVVEYGAVDLCWRRSGRLPHCRSLLGTVW